MPSPPAPTTCVGTTVEMLLAEELLSGTLAAGEGGTGRSVSWCLPQSGTEGDHEPHDSHGAAVFCTRRAFDAEPRELLARLHASGAAAVLLWPDTSAGSAAAPLDPGLAELADALELPVLLLPRRATFRETSQLIATKVLAQTTHVLEYGTRVHRALGDVFARGAGLAALTEAMARMSGSEVLVLNRGGELLAQSGTGEVDATPPPQVATLVERLAERGLFEDGPASAEVITTELGVGEAGEEPAALRDLVVSRVLVAGLHYGLLVVLEPDAATAEHDLAQHRVLVEQGVSLAGSELLRQQSVREAEERARNDFVHALLHHRFTDQFELAARAEHYRFPLEGRFAVLIISSPEVRPDDAMGRQRAVDVARAARRSGTTQDAMALSALIGSMIVVVKEVPATRHRDPERETATLRQYADQLLALATRRLGDGVRVTFGRVCDGAAGVARSYREARTAEALGRRVGTSPVTTYEDLRVFAALQDAATSRAGIDFAREVLAPLQDSDGQTGNLEAVALAYIAESGNLNATARRLHLHRNTMLYKLERTSRALNMDIRTAEAQFMVWLAHHLVALRDVTTQLDDELAPPH